jgi:hypothetical protein
MEKRRRQRMIRIAITAAAYDAICSTLPEEHASVACPSSGRPIASPTLSRPSSTV